MLIILYIVKLYSSGYTKGYFWTLLEFCNLYSLQQIGLPLVTPTRFKCLLHIINGLEYLHNKGIAHRDIKSDNIFANLQNGVLVFKLGDFNLARNISNNSATSLSFCGSYYTMAPEILNKEAYDVRCDMWSYLCVLVELINNSKNNPLCISSTDLIQSLDQAVETIEVEIIQMLHLWIISSERPLQMSKKKLQLYKSETSDSPRYRSRSL